MRYNNWIIVKMMIDELVNIDMITNIDHIQIDEQ